MRPPRPLILLLLILAVAHSARAVNYLWNVASGDWSTTGNWSPVTGAGGPTAGDAAILRNGGAVNYDLAGNSTVNRLLIGRDGNGTLTMNGGNRTVSSYLFVGGAYNQNSSGTLNLNGGTITVNGGWQHWGAAHTYNGEAAGAQANVDATAVINVNGGAIHVTNGSQRTNLGWTEGVANSGSGAGTLNLSAGTVILAGPASVGNDLNGTGNGTARGTINQTGGSLSTGSWLVIGYNSPEGTGTYNFSGGNLTVGGGQSLHVGVDGNGGQGHYTQSGTAVANVGGLIIGRGGGVGTVNLNGGSLTSTGAANFGTGGTAILNHQGGTLTMNSGVNFGTAGGFATVEQSGGTIQANANNWIQVAEGNGTAGTYNLTGGVLNVNGSTGTFSVGTRGTAQMTMSGNSILNVANQMIVARAHENQNNHATFTMLGGTATVGALNVGQNNGNATFNLEGGTLRTTQLSIGSGDIFNWGNGTLQVRTEVPGDAGTVDRTLAPTPSGPVVREGKVITLTGSATTGFGAQQNSRLDLGSLYLSNGTRYNQLLVTGALNLAASNDSLNFAINPYLLRPNSSGAEDYGTLLVVDAASITGTFDAFTGFVNDSIGWVEAPGSGVYDSNTNPASLPLNSFFWEYRTSGPNAGNLLFHYRVSFSVPEPGSFGLLCAAVVVLRTGRRMRQLRQQIGSAAE
jgi:hypothetical protein